MKSRKDWSLTIIMILFSILAVLAFLHIQQLMDEAKQAKVEAYSITGKTYEKGLKGRVITLEEALVLAGVEKLEELTGNSDITPVDINLYPDENLSIPSGHLNFGQMVHILQFDESHQATMVVSVLDHKIGWIPNNYVILVN